MKVAPGMTTLAPLVTQLSRWLKATSVGRFAGLRIQGGYLKQKRLKAVKLNEGRTARTVRQ